MDKYTNSFNYRKYTTSHFLLIKIIDFVETFKKNYIP